MAGGRDLSRRSPRWLNGLICFSGLAGAVCLLWGMIASDSDGSEAFLGTTAIISRVIAAAILPVLLVVTGLCRLARRLVWGVERAPAAGPPNLEASTRAAAAPRPTLWARMRNRIQRDADRAPVSGSRKMAA